MQKHFRCMNSRCAEPGPGRRALGHDFFADEPKCPKCGFTDKHARLPVTRLTVIHFDPPLDAENMIGHGHRACEPSVPIQAKVRGGQPDRWHQGTAALDAVTCPACKASQAYQDAVNAAEE